MTMETGFTFTIEAWQVLAAGWIAGIITRGWWDRASRVGAQRRIERKAAELEAQAEALMALAQPSDPWASFGRAASTAFTGEASSGSSSPPDDAPATRRRPRA